MSEIDDIKARAVERQRDTSIHEDPEYANWKDAEADLSLALAGWDRAEAHAESRTKMNELLMKERDEARELLRQYRDDDFGDLKP